MDHQAGRQADPAITVDAEQHEPDVTAPPYTGIGRMLRTAHVAFMRLFTLKLAQLGMTFSQFQHLQFLWVSDGITQVELAQRIGIRPAASTAVLLSLEQQGYIHRVRNEIDRRKVNVFLTSKGKAARPALLHCAKVTNAIASEGLTKNNLSEFRWIIEHMVENLTNALPQAATDEVADDASPHRKSDREG